MQDDPEALLKTLLEDPALRRRLLRASGKLVPYHLDSEREDLVHETLIKAMKGAHTFRGLTLDDAVKWAIAILKNLITDVLRARGRKPLPDYYDPEEDPRDEDKAFAEYEEARKNPPHAPPSDLKGHEDLQAVLTPKEYEVLLLLHQFEMDTVLVADLLRTTANNVRQIHFRANKKLQGVFGIPPEDRNA